MRIERDLVFNPDLERPLMLNMYSPDDGSPSRPLVVYVFGGAWRVGDRNQVESWMSLTELTASGFVVASLDYRLSTEGVFPAQIEDVWSAIGWIVARSERWSIDVDRIGVIGPSAGGHLAAMVGLTSGQDVYGSLQGIRAVADFYGPTDFLQMDRHSIAPDIIHDEPDSPESMLVGGPIQNHPDLVAAANPVSYVSSAAPPFMIVHGQLDRLVPHHQSEILVAALNNAGAKVDFHSLPEAGHGGFESAAWLEQVRTFFLQHLTV